MCAIKFSLV